MKKRPLELGDIFPIPSKIGKKYGFFFARVMHVSLSYTIEVFDGFETDFSIKEAEIDTKKLTISRRLHPPISAVFLFEDKILKTPWPILASGSSYGRFNSDYDDVIFLSPEYLELGTYFKGDKTLRDSSRNKIAEQATVWQPHHLVFREWYYANKLRTKGSVFDGDETVQELNDAGLYTKKLEEAMETSEVVAKRFIESGVDRLFIKKRSRR